MLSQQAKSLQKTTDLIHHTTTFKNKPAFARHKAGLFLYNRGLRRETTVINALNYTLTRDNAMICFLINALTRDIAMIGQPTGSLTHDIAMIIQPTNALTRGKASVNTIIIG